MCIVVSRAEDAHSQTRSQQQLAYLLSVPLPPGTGSGVPRFGALSIDLQPSAINIVSRFPSTDAATPNWWWTW